MLMHIGTFTVCLQRYLGTMKHRLYRLFNIRVHLISHISNFFVQKVFENVL